MGNNLLIQSPFAVLTFIVVPAILTNATSVLAMSTINRMLRARERMHELYAESEDSSKFHEANFIAQVNRVEKQGLDLRRALRWIYVSLGAFAAATLVTLLGAVSGQLGNDTLLGIVVGAGFLLGLLGVFGLVIGCLNLLSATQLSLVNIREEATLIRARQVKHKNSTRHPGTA